MGRQRGFSLIELLIVVAIILVLAALAVPNLIRSRMSANEASAVSSLHAIANAQTIYQITYPNLGYADQLTKLSHPPAGQQPDASHAGLMDSTLACDTQPCIKAGYQFSITGAAGTPVNSYVAVGTPQLLGRTGRRGFCANPASHITFDAEGGSNCSKPLE